MQFLLNLRLPLVPELVLSGPTQSLLAEALLWTIAVLLYANYASQLVRRQARTLPYWTRAKMRGGILCGNGQDDSVLLLLWAVHHGVAGAMMLVGLQRSDPVLWRHGYLLEVGYEVADTVAAFLPLYPYRMEGIKPEIRVAFLLHHSCGTLLAYPILSTVLGTNEHIQAIAMWLLLGASFSCFCGCLIYMLDLDRSMKVATLAFVTNAAFYMYCRFYQFPRHSYELLQDVQHRYSPNDFGGMQVGTVLHCLHAGLVSMMLFNVGVASDLVPKMVRYILRALDGTTPLDSDKVPKSRDSIHWSRTSVVKSRTISSSSSSASSNSHDAPTRGKRTSTTRRPSRSPSLLVGLRAIDELLAQLGDDSMNGDYDD
jgi:hypothetical protein